MVLTFTDVSASDSRACIFFSSSLKEESNLMKAISVLDFCCNEILPEIKNAVIKKSETEPKIINDDKCEISNSAAETLECRDGCLLLFIWLLYLKSHFSSGFFKMTPTLMNLQ